MEKSEISKPLTKVGTRPILAKLGQDDDVGPMRVEGVDDLLDATAASLTQVESEQSCSHM